VLLPPGTVTLAVMIRRPAGRTGIGRSVRRAQRDSAGASARLDALNGSGRADTNYQERPTCARTATRGHQMIAIRCLLPADASVGGAVVYPGTAPHAAAHSRVMSAPRGPFRRPGCLPSVRSGSRAPSVRRRVVVLHASRLPEPAAPAASARSAKSSPRFIEQGPGSPHRLQLRAAC